MQIEFVEKSQLFCLHTGHTTMLLQAADGHLGMAYYGPSVTAQDAVSLLETKECAFTPTVMPRDLANYRNAYPHAYPGYGCGDYREAALRVTAANGASAVCPLYQNYRIYDGKPELSGLPHSFGGDCRTLEMTLADEPLSLTVTLRYTLFADSDVIAQSVRIDNHGTAPLMLDRAMSACLTLDGQYDMITLNGEWARERHVQRVPLHTGRQSVGSICGISSHFHNPFFALCEPETTEMQGRVYGLCFVYSGNFEAVTDVDNNGSVRALMGLHPETFRWELQPDEGFQTPEVLLTCTAGGLGAMSRCYHDFMRHHLIRSPWLYRERPVLINNWEATYFDFNAEKILALADAAADCGMDLLVMDDGWFGRRNSDDSSLGDWFVHTEKLPDGIAQLGEAIRKKGLRFGIWFEPEMISPDSMLFQAHPDWAVQIPGRPLTLSRAQCVLDMTRPEIRDYLFERMCSIIREGGISYVKWDMNRRITEAFSPTLPPHRQGEFFHRYMLGVYDLMERLLEAFPDLLLEGCAGGGGRFDAGMLYYCPQIWTSDDTDAAERVKIQYGTSLCYPPSAMGAHVSACPNHTVARNSDFAARAHTALAGTFGYELDITKLSEDERAQIRAQIADYRRFSPLVREGDCYRLTNPFEDGDFAAWMFAAKDGSEILITCMQIMCRPHMPYRFLRLQGLIPDASYTDTQTGEHFSGSLLMQAGLRVPKLWGDSRSCLIHLKKD